jgi:hypothetical protein
MTDVDDRRSGRRQFLVGTGAVVLSGCLGGDGADRRELEPGPLQSIPSKPVPEVPRRLPVPIGSTYLDQSAARARELLSALPPSIDQGAIPNGAIREEVVDAQESATEALDRAGSSPTPFERMRALRDARESAARASAAWRAIQDGYSRQDALSARPEIAERLETFQGDWRYVGDDPIAAVLLCRELEDLTRQAGDHLDRAANPGYVEPDSPPGIGHAAGSLEYARCAIADGEHVYDGQTASSDDATHSLERTITEAARHLAERVTDRTSELPADRPEDPSSLVDRDVGDTPTGRVLTAAIDSANRQADDADERRSDGAYATAILEAHEALTAIRTYETLRDRIADGESFPIDTAEDVVGYRGDAVEAVRATLDVGKHPRLGRTVAGRLAREIEYADAHFEAIDADSTPSVAQIERDAVQYVRIGTAAEYVSTVTDTVASELEEH